MVEQGDAISGQDAVSLMVNSTISLFPPQVTIHDIRSLVYRFIWVLRRIEGGVGMKDFEIEQLSMLIGRRGRMIQQLGSTSCSKGATLPSVWTVIRTGTQAERAEVTRGLTLI